MAACVETHAQTILKANAEDLAAARGSISEVMLDRLALNEARIRGMAEGIREAAALPDPVGRVLQRVERPNGIVIEKTAVPMGLIAVIYESRPNVTSDAAALAVKSGSACVLRCGSEAFRSANAIVEAMREGLVKTGLPRELVSIVEDSSRQSAAELMTAKGLVDLLIPRGGEGLIRACVENATVPCIETARAFATCMSTRRRILRWPCASRTTRRPPGPPSATRWRSAWYTGTSPRLFCLA
jgi:glutamate-5-semialdehyde dehydrogenase